jgi:hypothetical protein
MRSKRFQPETRRFSDHHQHSRTDTSLWNSVDFICQGIAVREYSALGSKCGHQVLCQYQIICGYQYRNVSGTPSAECVVVSQGRTKWCFSETWNVGPGSIISFCHCTKVIISASSKLEPSSGCIDGQYRQSGKSQKSTIRQLPYQIRRQCAKALPGGHDGLP